jgi:hypothetical protein
MALSTVWNFHTEKFLTYGKLKVKSLFVFFIDLSAIWKCRHPHKPKQALIIEFYSCRIPIIKDNLE